MPRRRRLLLRPRQPARLSRRRARPARAARPGRVAAGARAPSCPAPSVDAFRCEQERDAFRARSRAAPRELGLQPLRWPEPFPFDSALAMRVATYAKSIGRTVPFAQAAFRQAFAGGRDLARARQRADRRRRLRDAPRGRARAAPSCASSAEQLARRPTRRRDRRSSATSPRSSSAGACSKASAALEQRRRAAWLASPQARAR